MKLAEARTDEAAREATAPAPAGARAPSGLRALLAVEEGSLPFDAAEFGKSILPAGSRVRLLTVRPYQFQPDSPWATLALDMGKPAALDPADYQITLRILETAGAHVSAASRYGSAPDEILAEAADWDADLILLGHHNGLGRWFQGSIAECLLKRSVIPVVVVPQLSETSARSARREAGTR
jgi:nucleotide-binding universal stress UspA family protein